MKAGLKQNMNQAQIKRHLKSAITDITPDILEQIDLSVPQEQAQQMDKIIFLRKKFRPLIAAAACLCVFMLTGGIYAYEEGKIVSVVGIDVNPSIEFSLNRRNKVVRAEAVNDDGSDIISGIKLKGSSLDTALYSVIHSMVDHGYLKEEENAVLVTVSDYRKKDSQRLCQTVVTNVEKSLEENQVKAVVYNQQIEVTDELKQLAGEYEISCGKAYFVQEIIEKNETLDMSSMEELSALKIDELSKEISMSQLDLAREDESKPLDEQSLEDMTIEEDEDGEADEDLSEKDTKEISSETNDTKDSSGESIPSPSGSSKAEESTSDIISDEILDENENESIATPGDAIDENDEIRDLDNEEGIGNTQTPLPGLATPLDVLPEDEESSEGEGDDGTENDIILLE